MTAIRRGAQAASFTNRNPEGAALAVILAGLAQIGAMMPPSRAAVATDVRGIRIAPIRAPLPGLSVAATPVLAPPPAPAPDQAFAINAATPLSTLPNPKATPFLLDAGDAGSRARALDCLTAALYYEAASESDAGQAAVAQIVLNRVRHPAFPKSVCAVVFDGTADHGGLAGTGGCQFTFTCDGAMARVPSPAGWQRARRAAARALDGAVAPAVGWSTHYHTQWVAPAWAPTLLKTAVIGAHIFYRLPAATQTARYAGIEPEIAQMAPLSSVPMMVQSGVSELSGLSAAMDGTQRPATATGGAAIAMVLPGI